MHRYFKLKRKNEKISKLKKVTIYGIIGIFISVLYWVGAFILKTGPQSKRKESQKLHNTNITPAITSKAVEKTIKIEGFIKKGDTIINILKGEGVSHQEAYTFFDEVKSVYNLKKIGSGKKYTLFLSEEKKEIKRFIYKLDPDFYFEAWRDEKGECFRGKTVKIPYQVKREFISGDIRDSLYESILGVGEKPELADMMASLYEYDVDFNRDIRQGDSYALLVEKKFLKGGFVCYGHVLAAQFTNRGTTTCVLRYTDPEGETAYYHPDGRSVKKMFLRCPLPFMRVTSRYGNRHHPLLNFSAHHSGIDLAAPVGTKIRSTASGIITKNGYQHSKGKFIAIRHKNQYVSHYYHLSRFAKGIKPGLRVEQGQIIGYVGLTGWTTGSHLHYGLQKSGRFINPLSLKSPTKDPVKKLYLDDFKQYAARVSILLSGSKLVEIPESLTKALLEYPEQPAKITSSPFNSIGH